MRRLRGLILVVIAMGSMGQWRHPRWPPTVRSIPGCGDHVDDDSAGLNDYPADPGCTSITDDDETNVAHPPAQPPTHAKCNAGRGNGSEPSPPLDCDPGNSGANNNGGE